MVLNIRNQEAVFDGVNNAGLKNGFFFFLGLLLQLTFSAGRLCYHCIPLIAPSVPVEC